MGIQPLRTEQEYQAALAELEALMDKENRTALLGLAIQQYERRHYPVECPDPIEAIQFRMEQQGLRQRDLIDIIGSRSKVSEVLNRKVPLTLSMIRRLHERLGISAGVLIQPYDLAFDQNTLHSPAPAAASKNDTAEY